MGFGVVLVGIFLFLFLVVVALLINPPDAWVQKFTDKKDKRG